MDRLNELVERIAKMLWVQEALMPSDETHLLLLHSPEEVVAILEGRTEIRLKKVPQVPADIKEKMKANETHVNFLVFKGAELEALVSLVRDKVFFLKDEDYRMALKQFCIDTYFDLTSSDLTNIDSTCARCRKVATGMHPCPKCCMVTYCDDNCRTLHDQHIDICDDIAYERRHNTAARD